MQCMDETVWTAILCLGFFLAGLLLGMRRRTPGRSPEAKAATVKSADLYIGNLSDGTSEEDIRKAFSRFGDVKDVRLIADRTSGGQKGFAFITMGNIEQAQASVRGMDSQSLNGQRIVVSEARSRRRRNGRR